MTKQSEQTTMVLDPRNVTLEAVATVSKAQVSEVASGPLALLQQAQASGATAEQIGQWMTLQERYDANAARQAFTRDLSAFQAEAPIIEPLDQGDKSSYAKLDRIHRSIRPLKQKYGLSVIWSQTTLSEDGKLCHLRGELLHRGGHSIDVAYDVPLPEGIVTREGKMITNAAQRMGSATTYGRRYGEAAILNLVMGKDDDGADGLGGYESTITPEQVATLTALLAEKGRTPEKLCAWAAAESKLPVTRLEELPAKQFAEALRILGGKAAGK